jgi:GntR family transcriptional regulator
VGTQHQTDVGGAKLSLEGGAVVSEPVYRQLARVCRDRLVGGGARQGDRFPSERDLARDFGVSRATANKVLSNLVAEGLLEHRPGIGMFVAENKTLHASLREMESFTGHARELGLEPETRVLEFRRLARGDVPEEVAGGMGLGPGEGVIFVERLRLAGGVPVILEFRWIRTSMVPGLRRSDLAGSCYALLEGRYGVRLAGERQKIGARSMDSGEARKLGVRPGAAALVVEGPGFAEDDTAVWYQVLLYRGDRYHLENLVRLNRRQNRTEIKLTRD